MIKVDDGEKKRRKKNKVGLSCAKLSTARASYSLAINYVAYTITNCLLHSTVLIKLGAAEK